VASTSLNTLTWMALSDDEPIALLWLAVLPFLAMRRGGSLRGRWRRLADHLLLLLHLAGPQHGSLLLLLLRYLLLSEHLGLPLSHHAFPLPLLLQLLLPLQVSLVPL
jgi:hypothetical protein